MLLRWSFLRMQFITLHVIRDVLLHLIGLESKWEWDNKCPIYGLFTLFNRMKRQTCVFLHLQSLDEGALMATSPIFWFLYTIYSHYMNNICNLFAWSDENHDFVGWTLNNLRVIYEPPFNWVESREWKHTVYFGMKLNIPHEFHNMSMYEIDTPDCGVRSPEPVCLLNRCEWIQIVRIDRYVCNVRFAESWIENETKCGISTFESSSFTWHTIYITSVFVHDPNIQLYYDYYYLCDHLLHTANGKRQMANGKSNYFSRRFI